MQHSSFFIPSNKDDKIISTLVVDGKHVPFGHLSKEHCIRGLKNCDDGGTRTLLAGLFKASARILPRMFSHLAKDRFPGL